LISDELKHATVVTALNDMIRRGWFSISCIDNCAEILGISTRGSEAHTLLRALHCVEFAKMPPEVRAQVPELIKQVLRFEVFIPASSVSTDSKGEELKRGFWRGLLGS